MKYIFNVDYAFKEDGTQFFDIYDVMCQEGITDTGKKKLLHNEIDVQFKVINNEIYVLGGWHIGTEDYNLEEGDDYTLEYYHPGITEQILAQMKEKGMI